MKLLIRFLTILGVFLGVLPGASMSYGATEDSYLSNVTQERESGFYEIFIFSSPPPKGSNLQESIFNRELSAEFKARYRERFGQLDSESIVYQNSKYLTETIKSPQILEQQILDRRNFADYMIKRLTEWHIDNYFKSEPTMRPVYEMKEKLSHAEVKISVQTKLDIHYSMSSNIFDFVLLNPYLDAKMSLEMDPKAFGPGQILEDRIYLGKQLSQRNRLNFWVALIDGSAQFEFVRQLTKSISSSISLNGPTKEPFTRESHLNLGLGFAN